MKLLPVRSWAEGGEEFSGNSIYASWSLAPVSALTEWYDDLSIEIPRRTCRWFLSFDPMFSNPPSHRTGNEHSEWSEVERQNPPT